MGDQEVIQVILAYHDDLHVANFVPDALRWLGWVINRGLAFFLSLFSEMFKQSYKLLDFWNFSVFQGFIKTYQPVFWLAAVIAFGWAGLMMMHRKNTDLNEKGNNLLVALLLFFSVTFFIKQGTDFVNAGLAQATVGNSSAVDLYKSNITDIYSIDDAKWPHNKGKANLNAKTVNQITNMTDVDILDINEKVDTGGLFGGSEVSDDGKNILKHQLSKNSKGKLELKNLKGWFGMDKSYYRYAWHPWFLFFGFISMIVVYVFTIFKVVKIEMEISFIGLLIQGLALTDIDSGKRNRQLIAALRDSFAVLFFLAILMRFYSIFNGYIASIPNSTMSIPTKLAVQIAAAFFMIDGPNVIQKIFGIDAGLSSMATTFAAVQGIGRIAKGTKDLGHKASDLVKKTASGTAKGAIGLTAGVSGFASGLMQKPELPANSGTPTANPEQKPQSAPAEAPKAPISGEQLSKAKAAAALPKKPSKAVGSKSGARLLAAKTGIGSSPKPALPKLTVNDMPPAIAKQVAPGLNDLKTDLNKSQQTLGDVLPQAAKHPINTAKNAFLGTQIVSNTNRIFRMSQNTAAGLRKPKQK